MGGLYRLHELPVAVVHDDRRGGVGLLDHAAHLPDLRTDREARVEYPLERWMSTAFTRGSAARLGHPLQVGLVVKEFYLQVFHAVVFQGAVALVPLRR